MLTHNMGNARLRSQAYDLQLRLRSGVKKSAKRVKVIYLIKTVIFIHIDILTYLIVTGIEEISQSLF